MIPPQVDALDDLPDILHPLQCGFVLYAVAHGGFNPLPEVSGNLQVGQHVDDLLIDRLLLDGVLRAGTIAAFFAQAAVVPVLAPLVPVGSHLAVILIHQTGGHVRDAVCAVHAIMQDIRPHHRFGFERPGKTSAYLLAFLK